jgi:D-alanyl-D-alanine carboxypeptidase/D-alanyl-D-alanine-endopeptidase (penicillin-binding protein 4)
MKPFSMGLFSLLLAPTLLASASLTSEVERFHHVDWNSYFASSAIFFGVALDAPEVYQKNSSEWLAPASNAKILVAGELLQLLGPDFRYRTELKVTKYSATRASLHIVGEGDPSWGMNEFANSNAIETIVDTLQSQGIQEVAENIELISRVPDLDQISFPLGWKREDFFSCGGTLAQSFNFDINCGTLEILSATKARWTSSAIPTPVELQLTNGSATNLTLELERNPWRYVVKGTWRAGSGKQTFFLPIYDTKTWITNLLDEKLRAKGIKRFVAQGNPVTEESLWLTSPPLSEMLKPYLKNSVNFLGDAFLKSLGVFSPNFRSRDIHDAGLETLKNRVYPLIGSIDFFDGSGLTRIARIRPEQLLTYLQFLRGSPHFPVYLEALAVAGVDGTLRNRMRGTAAQGNLRGKTGTLNGVYNLSGYVPQQNQWVPFVLLTRTTVSQAGPARSAQDKVGARLAAALGNSTQELPAYPFVERNSGEFWMEQRHSPEELLNRQFTNPLGASSGNEQAIPSSPLLIPFLHRQSP